MVQRENNELNVPARDFFARKMKCVFSTTEFRFSAGTLDVLAYNRDDKCFHVAEGKRANRLSAVGHAIGQLIAYISMLQESGFDFLDRISQEANLFLTDFEQFLEDKSIKVCFYIVLPEKQQSRILEPTQLVLRNVGGFGEKIGILFASKRRCSVLKSAQPIFVKIRRQYTRDQFLAAIRDKFLAANADKDLEAIHTKHKHLVQFRKREGNPYLHFEFAFHRKRKIDAAYSFSTAFHLEWSAAWQKNATTLRRANKIRKVMKRAYQLLKSKEHDFKYQRTWGKAWSRLYIESRTDGQILDDQELKRGLAQLQILTDKLVPLMDSINWGKLRKVESDDHS